MQRFLTFWRGLPKPIRPVVWRAFWRCHWGISRLRFDISHMVKSPNLSGSERAELIERICAQHPFHSVLEVGCAYGQNFSFFAEYFPHAQMVGIDPNEESVKSGNEVLAEKGLSHVELCVAGATDLSIFEDDTFDVVYSSAALQYLGPDSIQEAAREMLRVARRVVIVLEQHEENSEVKEGALGRFIHGPSRETSFWVRDYRALFSTIAPEECITVTRVPNPIWKTERWFELANVIEIECENLIVRTPQ